MHPLVVVKVIGSILGPNSVIDKDFKVASTCAISDVRYF